MLMLNNLKIILTHDSINQDYHFDPVPHDVDKISEEMWEEGDF